MIAHWPEARQAQSIIETTKKIQSRTPKAEISYQRVIHTHTHSIDAAAAAAFVKRASKIVWEIRSTATPNM